MRPLPTVLLPAYRRPESTRRCLQSLREAGAPPVILVDDEGTAGATEIAELARDYPGLDVVVTEEAAWWTGAVTLAARRALAGGAERVLFFNQDVTAPPGYFEALLEASEGAPEAIVGSAVLYRHDPSTVWSAGGRVEWWGRGPKVLYHGAPVASLPAGPFEVEWLFGMGTLVPAAVFERVGFPDGERFPMAWGDFDFSLRARRAGVRLLVEPRARLVHDVGGYDARVSGAPTAREWVSQLRDPRHNLSLAAQAEVWRRHGPPFAWPAALAAHVAFLAANFVRMRVLFPRARREAA